MIPFPLFFNCRIRANNPSLSAGVRLANLPNGKSLLVVGQKSGVVWAHDPDKKGALVWKSDISRGEIDFGGAMDDDSAYFAMRGGGIAAIRLSDGRGVKGFLVEAAAVDGARDISGFGGWRAYVAEAQKAAE